MEALVGRLKQIEVERRWWSPEIFLNMENETLKGDVKDAFDTHDRFIIELATNGTGERMQTFSDTVHEETPLVIVSVLTCFLDFLFKREELGQPISHQIVTWYRTQGWQFPKFKFEKLNDEKFKFEKLNDEKFKFEKLNDEKFNDEKFKSKV